jgi:hypothetical protein
MIFFCISIFEIYIQATRFLHQRLHRSTNVLQYLTIPLQAKYTVTKGKFSFNASLGMAYNILLKGTLDGITHGEMHELFSRLQCLCL